MTTAGFYRFSNQVLNYGTSVYAPNITLQFAAHESYSYPAEGWYWFDSITEAEAFFQINGASSADFVAFSEALLTENGYKAIWVSVLNIDPMLAIAMPAYLETFRTKGDWSQYLNSLGKAIALLETAAERQLITSEMIELSQRCHLPGDFIAAFQAIIPQSPP